VCDTLVLTGVSSSPTDCACKTIIPVGTVGAVACLEDAIHETKLIIARH
jgi:hypothetical protein